MKQRFEEFSETVGIYAGGGAQGPGAPSPRATVASVTGRLRTLFTQVEDVDLMPTTQQRTATAEVLKDAQTLLANWQLFKTQALPAMNQQLEGKGLPVIAVPK
jgi:hypothetical protein